MRRGPRTLVIHEFVTLSKGMTDQFSFHDRQDTVSLLTRLRKPFTCQHDPIPRLCVLHRLHEAYIRFEMLRYTPSNPLCSTNVDRRNIVSKHPAKNVYTRDIWYLFKLVAYVDQTSIVFPQLEGSMPQHLNVQGHSTTLPRGTWPIADAIWSVRRRIREKVSPTISRPDAPGTNLPRHLSGRQ